MIKWTDEAMDAAWQVLHDGEDDETTMRAALDAAVKAQGIEARLRENAMEYLAVSSQAMENYDRGRAEAMEEAAQVVLKSPAIVNGNLVDFVASLRKAAERIRALIKPEDQR